MDIEWCLTCERHLDGQGPYCSDNCSPVSPYDSPASIDDDDSDDEEVIFHEVHDVEHFASWVADGSAGITTWATAIPAGEPAGAPSPDEFLPAPRTPSRRPKLLSQRPVPPTLSMTTPLPSRPLPSPPIITQSKTASLALSQCTAHASSFGTGSYTMSPSNSSVATPISDKSPALPFDLASHAQISLASHVRSWVSSSPVQPSSPTPRSKLTTPPPPAFSVLAKSHHPSSALHIIPPTQRTSYICDEDLSSSTTASSISDFPPSWWAMATFKQHQHPQEHEYGPYAYPPLTSQKMHVHQYEEAYRTRGRRLSRA